ncbi:MAG: cupin domain-containing protein [Pseudomonadota bacterium]|nr:cupin domain-containing protein [Pseudomonadota bacterium]
MATKIDTADLHDKLEASLDRHCKTLATREPNSRVWALETKLDTKYARTQRRYLGTSGNVEHTDPKALMGDSFTLTIIEQPPGHEQPLHHHNEEEVFFVLEGKPTIIWEYAGTIVKRQLGPWDMIYNPAGQVHGVINESSEPCFFQVMLGNSKPDRPQYLDPELRRLQAEDRPDEDVRAKE